MDVQICFSPGPWLKDQGLAGESLIPSLMGSMFLLYSVSGNQDWIGYYDFFYWKGCWTVEQACQSGVKAGDEEGEKRSCGRYLPTSPFQGACFIKPKPCKRTILTERITALLFCWCLLARVALRFHLHLQHSRAPQEMPVPPRMGAGQDGSMAGDGSRAPRMGSHWNPLEPDQGFPLTCLLPRKCKTFLHYWVCFHNPLSVSKRSKRALKCRLKALMKYRTPQKDNLNFCHFKLCTAGCWSSPPG